MLKTILKKCQRNFDCFHFRGLPTLRERVNVPKPQDLYEPRFEIKRHYPDLQLINVKLKSYDFQPLEKFQSFVHWTAKNFGFDVVECYPLAHKSEQVKEYKPNSVTIASEYELKTYTRVVRIGPVPDIHLPLFVMFVQANAPVGVQIIIKGHEAGDETERYIPDPQLEDFKETLRNLDDPVVRKFLGWEA